jgi:hypothetical protein
MDSMVEYIPGGIFRAYFKFCMGDKIRGKMEGGKKDETFFIALSSAHTPIQIVFLNNFEIFRFPFKNEVLHKESWCTYEGIQKQMSNNS